MKLEKSSFDSALREAQEDAAAARLALEDANVLHEQHLAMVHAAAAKREGELEAEKGELQGEIDRLMKSLEEKSGELAAAEERANKVCSACRTDKILASSTAHCSFLAQLHPPFPHSPPLPPSFL